MNETRRADPLAVLASTAERAEPELAAIVQAENDDAEARSLGMIGERFADVADMATAGRTATMLDRLVHAGSGVAPTTRRLTCSPRCVIMTT